MKIINMETAPLQDPPENVLNILNDYCIRGILRQKKHLRDLLCAAETCKRFQTNAKECFRSKYGLDKIYFSKNPYITTLDRV